jgi:hypothetical protein
VLQRDTATAGEQVLIESEQAVAASMHVGAAGRLARVSVGLECRHDRCGVARGERSLIVAHDV